MAKKPTETEAAVGWGIRVAGWAYPNPYLANEFFMERGDAEKDCYHSGERPVRVAIVPLAAAKKAGLV